uniref:PH domain-containing protein n=1 Tax=Tetranychus urticae TaxID=32264 RepID=T1KC37_TETUR
MPCLMESSTPRSNDHLTCEPYTSEETIVHSGIVELASVKGSPKVFVVIHRTSTEHFVVFYPLRLIASARKPISTINLRSSLVSCPEIGLITIRPRKDIDGASITLRINPITTENINKWLSALSDYRFTITNAYNNNVNNENCNLTSDENFNSPQLITKQPNPSSSLSTMSYRHRYMPGASNCNTVRFGNYHLPPLVESVED